MRLTLVIASLRCGGAERVLSTMANYWAERGEEVTLLTLDSGVPPFYPLRPAVRHRPLDLAPEYRNLVVGLFRNLRRIRVFRRVIRESRPDAVISFMDRVNVLVLLATRGLGLPVLISERTDPTLHEIGRLWAALRRLTYPWAEALVCQSAAALAHFRRIVGSKGQVIANPVGAPAATRNYTTGREGTGKKRLIVAMGRLGAEKGFDLLLDAFCAACVGRPDWSLTIIGEGPLRNELEQQIKRLGLGGRVQFPGQVSDPFRVLAHADLFVVSSRFEGFPNALCEAMAYGLPVVSFDCPSGPAEIISHGVNGILVPAGNAEALADAVRRLMNDPVECERLARRAPEILDRFGVDKIMPRWDELIAQSRKQLVRGNSQG